MGGFRESFSKNTVYRFLDNAHMNWHTFLLRLSHTVIRHLVGLTVDKDNRYALIVDDSPLAKRGKAMELVSKYFNHVTMGYEYGYRVLTLAWTDGCTMVPILYSLLASSYDEKFRGKIRKDIDGRSLAGRIRKAAWKLSVKVNLLVKEKNKITERIAVKIVYLPNRANTKQWICILSTDTDMAENEIIRQYGKRWNIEVMFKCCKQYLRFGKDFKSPSFETQNAQIAIAFARYMMIAIEQRESEDYLEQHIVCDMQYAVISIAPNATWDSLSPMKENRFSTSVTPSSNEQSVTGVPTTSA